MTSADKVAILRFLKKNPNLTVRDVEKSRLGNTPFFKEWLRVKQPRKDKTFSPQDIEDFDIDERAHDLVKSLVEAATVVEFPFEETLSPQTLPLDGESMVFALAIPVRQAAQILGTTLGTQAAAMASQYSMLAERSGHPTRPGQLLAAWVRYTDLGETLWVHEAQTDHACAMGSRHLTGDDQQEFMPMPGGDPYHKEANMWAREVVKERQTDDDKALLKLDIEVFKQFLGHHSDKKVVFPTASYKLQNYPADMFGDRSAPVSVFNEMPRRLRFDKATVSQLGVDAPEGEVWVHASVQEVPHDSDLHERIAEVLRWTVHDVHTASLATLRELVRPVDKVLAEEISRVIRDGGHIHSSYERIASLIS